MDGRYDRTDILVNGKVTYENEVTARIIVHDRTSFMVGKIGAPEFPIYSSEGQGTKDCPDQVERWTEVDNEGPIYNRYVKVNFHGYKKT
jgi:hypothetical protein